jgi:hypothetical protein
MSDDKLEFEIKNGLIYSQVDEPRFRWNLRMKDDYWKRAEDERKEKERKKYEASVCFGCIHHDACYAWCEEPNWMYEQKECDNRRVAMTPEEFAKEMMDIRKKYIDDREWPDREYAHEDMDFAMEKLLESLGYGEGVAIFDDTYKWYA